MENIDYILPLGTVIRTKTGDMPLMIVGRAQLYNDNGQIGYFDYSAVPYPQGIVGDGEFLFFNDEDIAEMLHEGYRNEQEIEFADHYEENIKQSQYPKLHVGAE